MKSTSSLETILLACFAFLWDLFHPRQSLKVGSIKRQLRADAKQLQRSFKESPEEQGKIDRAVLAIACTKRAFRANPAALYLKKRRFHKKVTDDEKSLKITKENQLRGCFNSLLYIQQEILKKMGETPLAASLDQAVERTLGLMMQQIVAAKDVVFEFEPVPCSRCDILVSRPGEDNFFRRVMSDLEDARSHINIAMYGIRDEMGREDSTANRITLLLEKKARQGIEVNFLFDAFGTGLLGPRQNQHCTDLISRMSEYGVKCVCNDPWNIHDQERFLRLDHRKLYVIDGNIAYLGGMGIEDKFENNSPGKRCHDVMARLEGDIVKQFQCVFLSSFTYQWRREYGQSSVPFDGSKESMRDKYFPKSISKDQNLKATCMTNIPVAGTRQISEKYLSMIKDSKEHIYIMNPYCSEDDIAKALKRSTKRFCKAQKVWANALPRPQGILALLPNGEMKGFERATKNYKFPGLLNAGMKILLYDQGWLHGKVAVQDNRKVIIGSCNFDVFSMSRNWEIAVYFEDKSVAHNVITEIFLKDEPPKSHLASYNFSWWQLVKYKLLDLIDRWF
jgi:phosphatidylserine/phosphatidylglycerophosphate/cardiolipin synthase-like enzyme